MCVMSEEGEPSVTRAGAGQSQRGGAAPEEVEAGGGRNKRSAGKGPKGMQEFDLLWLFGLSFLVFDVVVIHTEVWSLTGIRTC